MNDGVHSSDPQRVIAALRRELQQLRDEKAQLVRQCNVALNQQDQDYTTTVREQVERERLLETVALRIHQSSDLNEILSITVAEVRQLLQTDRVMVYRFDWGGTGQVMVESVAAPIWSLQRSMPTDSSFALEWIGSYRQQRIQAIDNLATVKLAPSYAKALAQLHVQANLVVPLTQSDELWGLLIAQQCSAPRHWQESDVELLKQLATQVAIAIQKVALVEQLQTELIERRRTEASLKQIQENLQAIVQERTAELERANAQLQQEVRERQQTETQLKLFERAIISSSNGIVITDATRSNNPVIYVNPGFERMTGYTSSDVVGRNCRFLQGPEVSQPGLEELRAALQDQRDCNITLRNYRKDGSLFWNELSISPVRDDQGRVTHYVGVQTDLTGRVQAEERLRVVADFTYDWEYWVAADGHLVYVSPSCTRITGYPPNAFLQDNRLLERIIHPDDRPFVLDRVLKNSEQDSTVVCDFRIITHSGETRWISHVSQSVYSQDGRWLGKRGSNRDITDRKQVESALRESEERFRRIFNQASVGIFQATSSGHVVLVNQRFIDIVQYTAEELKQKQIQKLIYLEDLPNELELFRQLWAGEQETISREKRYVRKDGSLVWVHLSASVVRDVDGEPLYFIGIVQDIQERRQTEDALRNSQALLAEAEKLAHLGSWRLDVVTGAFTCSDEMFRICGLQPVTPIAYSEFAKLVHPDDIEHLQQTLQHAIRMGTSFDIEFRLNHANSRTRFLISKGYPIFDEHHQVVQLIGSVQDITEQKQSEIELRNSEERYRRLIETTLEGVWITDTSNKTTFVNAQMATMLGYSIDEMLGTSMFDFMDEREYQTAVNYLQRRRRGIAEQYDFRFRRKNGDSLWTLISTSPLFSESGDYSGAVAMMTDITERKQMEAVLRESEERFRLMADHAPVLIWVSGVDAGYNFFNQTWLNFTGRSLDDELGHGWIAGVHPDDRDRCRATYLGAFQTHQSFCMEYRLRRADGDYRWLRDEGIPRFAPNGEFMGYIGSCVDVTDGKQAQEMLQALNTQLRGWVDQLELRNQEMTLLGKMNGFLQACSSVGEAYEMLADLLKPLFPDCSGGVFMLSASGTIVDAVASWGDSFLSQPLFKPNDCWALRRGHKHWSTTDAPGLLCQHMHYVERSLKESLCIPMMAQGEALGVFHLSTTEKGVLTEAKQQLARTVAEQVALAIANIQLRETLKNQSIRDPLTGLFNRRYLEEFLEQEIHRARRNQHPVGIIMLDIDHFKRFNDTFGHDAGDLVLQVVGRLLKENFRGSDIACRYGGEEMTLILPEATLDETQRRAEQVRDAIRQLRLEHEGYSLGMITSSFGVACFPQHGTDSSTLIQAADTALYQAKAEGRDRVVASTVTKGLSAYNKTKRSKKSQI